MGRITRSLLVGALIVGFVAGQPLTAGSAAGSTAVTESAAVAGDACRGAPRHGFTDVPASHRAAVDCVFWYGLIRGTTVDTFEPAVRTTRGVAAAVLYRVLKAAGASLPAPARPAFTDLAGNPHRDVIERLAHAGIVAGLNADRFGADKTLTRARLATWTLRARTHVSGPPPRNPPDAYRDDDGYPLERQINQAAALGIAPALPDGRFAPGAAATRGDVAQFGRALLRRLGHDGELRPRSVRFEVRTNTLSGAQRRHMTGVSWRKGCPVALADLRLVETTHWRFDGTRAWGAMVVHRDVATNVAKALREVYDAGFPIRRMHLVERYGGSDARSMRNDNSSAFNCRRIAGTTRWSEHAYGRAIDLNPVENPYVRGSTVEPAAGRDYLDRSKLRPGMIVRGGPVVEAFNRIGWGWGGAWTSGKDYQHFSRSGR